MTRRIAPTGDRVSLLECLRLAPLECRGLHMAPETQPHRGPRARLTAAEITKLAAHAGRDPSTVRRWARGDDVSSTSDSAIGSAMRTLGLVAA